MPDTTVKIFHSGMPGAPVLTGQAGALIAILDACLVNGFGSGTVDSVVISGGIATVTRSTGHSFEVDTVAEISGAAVTGGSINGEQKVLTTTATTYTFDATGIPNQTATGTITHKLASAGWGKVFTGTNLAVYRSNDLASTRFFCRVDDTATQNARARGFEVMTDINTGTGLFPTDAQSSGGYWWPKSQSSDATARAWTVFASGRTFYLLTNHNSSPPTARGIYAAFGDMLKAGSTDQYAAFIHGPTTNWVFGSVGAAASPDFNIHEANSSATCAPRPLTGIGGAQLLGRAFPCLAAVVTNSGTGSALFPNPADSGIYLSQWTFYLSTGYRGRIPGYYGSFQNIGTTNFTTLQRVVGVLDQPNRVFRAINTGSGCVFFDVTGPW